MATTTIARPSTAPHASPLLPLHTYTPNRVSDERPMPLRDMPQLPGTYQQLPQAEDSHSDHEETSPESETTLTPDSTEDHEQTQEVAPGRPRFGVPALIRLLNSFPHHPLFRQIPDNSPIDNEESEYFKIKYEKLEDFEKGIPQLATLLDSNESFCIFRRYGSSAARILLHREIELGQLIDQLHKLDKEDAASDKIYRLQSVEHQDGWNEEQKTLIDTMEVKIKDYYDLLLKYLQVRDLGQPPQRDQRSVCTWIRDNLPLVKGEDAFILYIDDLISAKKMESNKQQGNKMEDMLDWLSSVWPGSFLDRLLKSKNGHMKTDDPLITHHSSSSIAILARIIIVFLAVNFLLIPVFLLFLVPMTRPAMTLTVMGFVLAFAVVLAGIQAKAQEILIGTAAYGAFLVTFLGNMNSGCALGTGSQ